MIFKKRIQLNKCKTSPCKYRLVVEAAGKMADGSSGREEISAYQHISWRKIQNLVVLPTYNYAF